MNAGFRPTRLLFFVFVLVFSSSVNAQTLETRFNGHALEPVFSSTNTAFTSYVRLWNDTATNGSATVDVTIVDAATGNQVGTWSVLVGANRSLQFPISDIEEAAGIVSPPDQYVFYLDWGDHPFFGIKFQHVVWSPTSGFFESLSGCRERPQEPKTLANLHTSTISQYPSLVIIHSEERTEREVRINVREAGQGTSMGSYILPSTLPAFGSVNVAVSEIENAVSWIPSSTEFHMIVDVETRVSGDPFFESNWDGWVTHVVQNDSAGSLVNMTPHCIVTASGAVPPN